MKMCMNWKVLAGLAVVLVGIRVAAPALFVAALPLALMAACPLSMLLMMRGMTGSSRAPEPMPADAQPNTTDARAAVLRAELERTRAREEELAAELSRISPAQSPAPVHRQEAVGSVGR